MTGTLVYKDNKWFVKASIENVYWSGDIMTHHKYFPVYSGSLSDPQLSSPMFWTEGRGVTFEIVDEFTHPQLFENVGWGDGANQARIIYDTWYDSLPPEEEENESDWDVTLMDGLEDDELGFAEYRTNLLIEIAAKEHSSGAMNERDAYDSFMAGVKYILGKLQR